VLLFALMAVPDLGDGELAEGGLPYLVRETLGEGLGRVFLCDVVFAITVCVLAVHTGTVRLLFAMARDNNLPFSRSLARVSESTRTPVVPALLTGGLAAGILLANINFARVLSAVTAVSIVWANLAYLLVTGPLLWRRLRGWPARGGSGAKGVFALGAWGVPVNVLAVLCSLATAVNMAWPRTEVYGEAWYQRYAAVLLTVTLAAAGGLYYGLVQRHKERVRGAHPPVEAPAAAGGGER
jgi:amino acid transporter